MGSHLIDGEFQSDKYPTCPVGKVPLSTKDPMAQDLLWEYAQRRTKVDPEFSADLVKALALKGFVPKFRHYLAAILRLAPTPPCSHPEDDVVVEHPRMRCTKCGAAVELP